MRKMTLKEKVDLIIESVEVVDFKLQQYDKGECSKSSCDLVVRDFSRQAIRLIKELRERNYDD
jgi:hypothetical protein